VRNCAPPQRTYRRNCLPDKKKKIFIFAKNPPTRHPTARADGQ
jgi:hypothetical protein